MSDLATYPTSNAERHGDLGGSWLMSLPSTNTQRAYRRDLVEWFAFLDAREALPALIEEEGDLAARPVAAGPHGPAPDFWTLSSSEADLIIL